MVAEDAPAEDESLPGMVPDDPGDEASEMSPTDPEDTEEPAPVSEEVMPEPDTAPEMENTDDADVSLFSLSILSQFPT